MASNVAFPETIRSIAFGSISGTYATIGTAFTHALRIFRVVNATDGDIFVSVDGINDNYFLPAGTFVLYDIAGNSGISSNFRVQANTQFYVRYSVAPSKSSVYVEAIYGKGE